MNKIKRRNNYGPEIKAKCKDMLVREGLNVETISQRMKGRPHQNSIRKWARKKENGKTWYDLRNEYQDMLYENLSPQSQAEKILQRINFVLQKDLSQFSTADADSLAKLQKMMERVVDKKFQIPMLYELLTKLIEFLKSNYKELVTKELINAVRHFKNELKNELELGNVAKTL